MSVQVPCLTLSPLLPLFIWAQVIMQLTHTAFALAIHSDSFRVMVRVSEYSSWYHLCGEHSQVDILITGYVTGSEWRLLM